MRPQAVRAAYALGYRSGRRGVGPEWLSLWFQTALIAFGQGQRARLYGLPIARKSMTEMQRAAYARAQAMLLPVNPMAWRTPPLSVPSDAIKARPAAIVSAVPDARDPETAD